MTETYRRPSLRVSKVAEELDVSVRTVHTYITEGQLEAFALPGGQWRVYRDSLDLLKRSGETNDAIH